MNRRQERIGWLGGWLGGFIWVAILSVVVLLRGQVVEAATGTLLCCAAVAAVVWFSPWRHPRTPYRNLMLPIYALLVLSLAWAVWSFGGLRGLGINGALSLPMLLPILLPLWLAGSRRWRQDGER